MTRRDAFTLAERGSSPPEQGPFDRSLSDQSASDQQSLDQELVDALRERGVLDAAQRDVRPPDQAPLPCMWGQEGSVLFSDRVEFEAPFEYPLALRWTAGQLFLFGFSGDARGTFLRVGLLNASQEEPRSLHFRSFEVLPFTGEPFEPDRNILSQSSEVPFLFLHGGRRGLELIAYHPFERNEDRVFEREQLLDDEDLSELQLAAAQVRGERTGLFAYTELSQLQEQQELQIASLRRPNRDTSFIVPQGDDTRLYWHPSVERGLLTYPQRGRSLLTLWILDPFGGRLREREFVIDSGFNFPRLSSDVLPVEDGFLVAVAGRDRIRLLHLDFNGREITERGEIPILPQPETLSGLQLFSLNEERLILFWHREGRQLSAVPLNAEGRIEREATQFVDLPPTREQRLMLAHDGSQRFFLVQQRSDNTLTVGGFSFACF